MIIKKIPSSDKRSTEQIQEHYQIEKELASRLRNSSKEERQKLYTAVYTELLKRVLHHPRWTKMEDPEASRRNTARQMKLLRSFLNADSTYLEIGPGDCAVSLEATRYVKKVYAVDVTDEMVRKLDHVPENFEFIVSNGSSIAAPENSVDVAYSNQLMEHLHPDDAVDQLENIYSALKKGAVYVCITPNRLYGPNDVSKYFDRTATCFHLKEYTVGELYKLFRRVGFSKIWIYIGGRGLNIRFPIFFILILEGILDALPFDLRRRIAATAIIRALIGVKIVGRK